ncbi:S8 family peptidase [Flavilitoribacter nigricans]|uniref:Subtilisin n=1 Tax=Flavilitoribacter nigricans (strain ATCC 23147 / DSM 23189 / NBRC 102662 / NCIMB 1420 / SS-2) TaxID=1122177 RepID=A0A2D0NJ46_FLAN2|nr:S8 family serine peptidase [Flavilitoribacter nigricans]PHN08525.1 subtilisin [Flavilitoribacter nigricans DSM 23189 = NBRC 102662]
MLSLIYVAGFGLSALFLALWFYKQRRDGGAFFPIMLLMAIVAFVVGVASSELALDEKLLVLFRDLTVLGFIGLFSRLFLKRFPLFLFGLLLLAVGLRFYYNNFMQYALIAEPVTVEENWSDDGELLIELAEGADLQTLEPIFQYYGVRASRAFQPKLADQTELDDYYVLDIPNDQKDWKGLQKALDKSGIIDWVEGNESVSVSPIEANRKLPEVNRKYGINDPGLEHLWSFEVMSMDQLYDFLDQQKIKPKKTAVVAILDTGVDSKHEDLTDNFTSINSKYDNDPRGHGTHCAGIAGAVSNNQKGVASYSRNNGFVKLTSIKVLNSSGMGTQQTIINGIIEAADRKVDVISLSLGGYSNQTKQRAYEKAVKYANKAGCIVVAAAGNSNRNAKDFSPVNAEGVIGVSAISEDLSRAVFSNTVEDIKMGVAAPGTNIYSTIPGNNYASYNGTSMATPYVSGLIGLMKSINPKLDSQQAYEILHASGKDTRSGSETGQLIQPLGAIKQLMK